MPRGMGGAPAMVVVGDFGHVGGAKMGMMKYFSLCGVHISSDSVPEIVGNKLVLRI